MGCEADGQMVMVADRGLENNMFHLIYSLSTHNHTNNIIQKRRKCVSKIAMKNVMTFDKEVHYFSTCLNFTYNSVVFLTTVFKQQSRDGHSMLIETVSNVQGRLIAIIYNMIS